MATTPAPVSGTIPDSLTANRISSIRRMAGVFFEPSKTFAEIAARPNWIVPMLLMTLISVGLSVAINQRVDWKLVFQHNLERTPRAARTVEQLPPAQQEGFATRTARMQRTMRYGQGFLGTLVLAVFLAGVYFGVFNIFANLSMEFSAALSLMIYALLPISLRELAGIPVVLMADRTAINPANYFYANVGAFLGPTAPLWQVSLLTSLDLFTFWSVALVGIGFAAANPKKISLAMGLTISFVVYAFFVLVPAAFAAIVS